MIGLVRELTRASLFAAASKPRIALAWRPRMKSSRVNALTMRMPCAVSCSNSIICIAPWNSLAMILRTRMPILRTPTAASGTNISAKTRKQGVLRHHHDHQTHDGQGVARQRGDEEIEDGARRLGDESLSGDEFGRVRAAVIADLHPEHLVEDALLNVGDDAVRDPRQHHLLAVGRRSLDRIDRHDRRRDLPDGLQVPADEDLVDDLADDPGGERRGEGDQAHHREGKDVALPVLGALVEKKPPQDGVRGRSKKRAYAIACCAPE